MPTFNSCDSALNLNKCFENTPPTTLKIDNLPTLPADWLTILENKLHETNPNLAKNIFFKHIGDISDYKSKKFLTEQLSLLTHRLLGNLDSQLEPLDKESYQLLILGLIEEIHRCTEGFHIRVNNLVNSLYIPQSLGQLLYLVRKAIVQEIASTLTNQDKTIYQVHVADRVIRIAEKLGLGLTPNIKKDRYKGLIAREKICQVLTAEFPKQYAPLKIPFLLTEQLQTILNRQGYAGSQETGYAIGLTETLMKTIENFLPNPAQSSTNKLEVFFILDQVDEFGIPTRIYDLNWPLIRQLFLKKLINEGYLIEKPKPTSLIEYAYFQTLIPENASTEIQDQFINDYLESKNYAKLLDDLHFIQSTFSTYWPILTKNSLLVENIDKFFEFLNSDSRNLNTIEQSKRFTVLYKLFYSQTKDFILNKIVSETKINLSIINDNLFFKSVQYNPEIIKEFLDIFLKKYNNLPQKFLDLLIKQNNKDYNLLMLAARYHISTLQHLLFLLDQKISYYEKFEISALFLSHNTANWNLLSLAAKYPSDAIDVIFNFIEKNSYFFDFEIINHIFNQKVNDKWCFIQFLIRYGTESSINRCLNFISKKINSTPEPEYEDWLALILNKRLTGNLLRMATQFNHCALKVLLDFMSKHSKQLAASTLQHLFLETNDLDWNCLHAAAAKNSQENTFELELILQFISEQIDQFDTSSLQALFLAQTQCQHNFLHLAVFHRPDSLNTIFEFLSQHHSLFGQRVFQQLLLQQDINGFNCLSSAFPHPIGVENILSFIDNNPDSFPKEVIKEIILQENKWGYTSLHVMAEYQPDSLKVLLAFIDNKLELFTNDFNFLFQSSSRFQRINSFFKKPPCKTNLLSLSLKHQPESAVHFSNFLNTHANIFNLKKPFLKNFIGKTISKTVVIDTQLSTKSLGFNHK